MIHPAANTQEALQEAIERIAVKHDAVWLTGEYPLSTTLAFRHPDRPGGFLSTTIAGGGPAWEAIEWMDGMNWGGAALDWKGGDNGVMVQADGIFQTFRGLSWFAKGAEGVVGVDVPLFPGVGTGQHLYDSCGFHRTGIAVRAGRTADCNCDAIRYRSCVFNHIGICHQQRNWQGVDSIIESSAINHADTVFDVVQGGKFTVRGASVFAVGRIFHVHASSHQVNTFVIDGLSIDAGDETGADNPTLIESDALGRVRLIAENVHCSHPHVDPPLLKCTNDGGTIEATLRSVHRVGALCAGRGEILVFLDACTLMPWAVPFWGGGLTSGWARWKDGRWTDSRLERIG